MSLSEGAAGGLTTATPAAAAIGGAEFAALMAAVGPFEPQPRVAVAVSGGADSMALALLVRDWAAAHGGTVVCLTVDHGLRPESGEEAAQVQQRLAALGLAHAILPWGGVKPTAGLQAAARAARHSLLARRCREDGIPHLLLAHHRDDQAETVLLRLARGSGVYGLAAMPAIRATDWGRLVRPLLGQPKDRLLATCRAHGLAWVEDPSNLHPGYGRGRLRRVEPLLAAEGLTAAALAETARRAGLARMALEAAVAALLADASRTASEGYLRLALAPLRRAPLEVACRSLAACLLTIGTADYPPRQARTERLVHELRTEAPAPRTLGGCRVIPEPAETVLIVREPVAAVERLPVPDTGGTLIWDRRFEVTVPAPATDGGPLEIACLGGPPWPAPLRRRLEARRDLPRPVLPTLPALWQGAGSAAVLRAVPHLGYAAGGGPCCGVRFVPARPLVGPGFVATFAVV